MKPSEFVEYVFGIKLFNYQKFFIDYYVKGNYYYEKRFSRRPHEKV